MNSPSGMRSGRSSLTLLALVASANAFAQTDPTRPPDAAPAAVDAKPEGNEVTSILISGKRVEAVIDGHLVQVGEEIELLSVGDAAFAASGIVHSIRNPGPQRLVVMAVLAPPPRK